MLNDLTFLIISAIKVVMEFFPNCSQVRIELTGNEGNHEKALPVKDKENKCTLISSMALASPS
jgi:hypothetical protein